MYAHWRDSGHDILPTPTIDVPKRRLGFPSKARAMAARAGGKHACRLYGVTSVLWRWWLATRPRRLDYVAQYESTLAELGRNVAKTDETYVAYSGHRERSVRSIVNGSGRSEATLVVFY